MDSDGALGRGLDGRLTLAARVGLVVICLAVFLSALDQYVVFGAFTGIMSGLGIPSTRPDQAAWIVNGYLLGYIVAMPLMGRAADLYGRRRIFGLALSLFTVGSFLCGLTPILASPLAPDPTTLDGALLTPLYTAAQWFLGLLSHIGIDTSIPDLTLIVGARGLQAVGGGALVPVGIALVGDLFVARQRALMLGLLGAITEAGGVLGPLWGAWITDRLDWQWIFYLNVPLALILLIAGLMFIPAIRHGGGRIDLLGAALFGALLICLSLGFGLQTGNFDVVSGVVQPNPWLLVAAAVLLVVFVGLELLFRSPVIDLRLFQRVAVSAAMVLSALIGVALVAALGLIPLFTHYIQGVQDPLASSITLLRMMVFIPVGAIIGGWVSSRLGCPLAALLGAIAAASGLYVMSLWTATVDPVQVTIATTAAGLGFGMVIAPINTSALNASGSQQSGMSAAMVTVLRMTGMLLGLSWLLVWGVSRFWGLAAEEHLSTQTMTPAAFKHVLQQVFSELFLIAAVVALAGVVPALLLWRKPRERVSVAAANG